LLRHEVIEKRFGAVRSSN